MSESAATAAEKNESEAPAGHLRATAKHGIIYSIGVILSRLIGFVMIPIYTRVLQPEDYGILEILSLTTDVVSMLAGFGIGLAVIRTLYRYDSEADRGVVASSAALLLTGAFGLIALLGVIFAAPIASLLLGEHAGNGGEGLVRLTVLGMASGSLIEVPMAMLRARQQSTSVVAVGMVRLLLSLTLNIVLVVVLRLGVAGVLWSTLITSATVGAWLMFKLLRESGIRFSTAVVRQLVAFGAPLAIWNLASFTMHYSDRYFLRTFGTFDDVGLYSLSYKLAMLLPLLVAGPFSDIWIPKSLEIERKEGPDAPRVLRSIVGYYNVLLITVALGIALFAGDVIRLVTGPAFHSAAEPVPMLVLAMVFFSYRAIGQLGALIRGRSDLIAVGTVVAASTALALNFVLIPRYGILGAAMATALGFGVEFFLMRRLSASVYDAVVPLGELARPLLVAVTVWIATALLMPADWGIPLRVVVHVFAVATYVAGLFVSGALSGSDRRVLQQAIQNPRWFLAQLKGQPAVPIAPVADQP
jgi:O-antigen/teichoic acid export membrane protein